MEASNESVLAVVLAAGGGTRFAGPHHKLLSPLGPASSVAGVAIRHALDARIGPVLVVTGAADLGDVLAAVTTHDRSADDRSADGSEHTDRSEHTDGSEHTDRSEPGDDRVDAPALLRIHNPRWADGQATSLHTAVAEAERRGVEAIVVGLADQPFIGAEAWRRVAAADAPIAIATYDGRRRNPVRLHRSVWPLLPTTGDEGARSVTRLHPELVQEVPCPGSPADIDTLEDLAPWQSRSSTNSP